MYIRIHVYVFFKSGPQKPWTVQYGLLWDNHPSSCKLCHRHKHGKGNGRMPESSTAQWRDQLYKVRDPQARRIP